MKTASDYHGTWENLSENQKQGVDHIITGSGQHNYPEMYDAGVHVPIYFNIGKKDTMSIALHKANIIKQTGVKTYYENEPTQVALLKLFCPDTKIIKIGGKN